MTSGGFRNAPACRDTLHTILVDKHGGHDVQSLKSHALTSPDRLTVGLDATNPRLCGCLRYSDWERAHVTHCAELVQTSILLQPEVIHRKAKLFDDGTRSPWHDI